MNKQHVISIANSFSRYPAGRFLSDGPYSGEKFRDEYLIPAIHNGEPVIIELDGVRGYGSSFLEEAFGGLVRKGIKKDAIKSILTINTSRPSLKLEIEEYIADANPDV